MTDISSGGVAVTASTSRPLASGEVQRSRSLFAPSGTANATSLRKRAPTLTRSPLWTSRHRPRTRASTRNENGSRRVHRSARSLRCAGHGVGAAVDVQAARAVVGELRGDLRVAWCCAPHADGAAVLAERAHRCGLEALAQRRGRVLGVGPVVGAERRQRAPAAAYDVGVGVVCVGVAHGDRGFDFGAVHERAASLQLRGRGVEDAVDDGQLEAAREVVVVGPQRRVAGELHDHVLALDRVPAEAQRRGHRSLVDGAQRFVREAFSDRDLAPRVHVRGVAEVDRDHRFTARRGSRDAVLHLPEGLPVSAHTRQLDHQERQIVSPPVVAEGGDDAPEERLVLVGVTGG